MLSRSWFGILIAKFRSSRPDVFCEKSVLRNFAKFTGKHLCQGLFLIKLQTWGLQLYLIRDSGTGVFLWILRNFSEQLFHRTPPDDCFCELSFELTLLIFSYMYYVNQWLLLRILPGSNHINIRGTLIFIVFW